ncbi:MAG: ABC transporter ATP-binding protein/permease [Firmicutes bacterium]|nr:ABC transporter ATP-binding protein/permease [Bacillota bacterium]
MKKNKQKQTNIKPYLHQFYRGNMGYLILAILSMLFTTATALMTSWLLQQFIDLLGDAYTGFSLPMLLGFAGVAVALLLVSCGLEYVSEPRFLAKAVLQYRDHVFSALAKKGIAAFSGENTAAYISALSNDVNSIETGYLSNLFVIVQQTMLFVGALAMMFYNSPLLTVISIAIATLPLAAAMLTGGLVAQAEKKVSDANETYMSTLRDALAGFSVVKAFRAEKQICRLFLRDAKAVADAKERKNKRSIVVGACASLAGYLLQIGIFLIGVYLALSGGAISAGTVLLFVQLLNYVISPVGAIPKAIAECRASRALIAKLADSLEKNVREEGAEEKRTLTQGITASGLCFAYEEDKPVLHDLSFRFEAGKSYCLVGSSGSGKSTLLDLLMASHHGYTGSIRYDDTELSDISSESLYEMVSVIQQNVFIFNASIRDNITMFSDFPRAAVDSAIEMSGLGALIRERGEDYLCGENGCGLSGGEKQRVAIARSLLKNSQVLLVDEATAALDPQMASQVTSSILNLQGITRIMVTHALEEPLLRQYDCILTLKNGRITEYGTFDALMARKEYFYSLFTVSQA